MVCNFCSECCTEEGGEKRVATQVLKLKPDKP